MLDYEPWDPHTWHTCKLQFCHFVIENVYQYLLIKRNVNSYFKKKKLIINSFLLFIWILDLHFSLVCMNVLALACYFSNSFENWIAQVESSKSPKKHTKFFEAMQAI